MGKTDLFGRPFQLKFVRPAEMLLFANAICDPPLGQATVIPFSRNSAQVTIIIESSRSFSEQQWEVVIKHNGHDDQQWQEVALQEHEIDFAPLAVGSPLHDKVYRRYFGTELLRPADSKHPLRFTFKYRLSVSESWKWANETLGQTDGEIYFQSVQLPDDFRKYFHDGDCNLDVQRVSSESPGARLWSIKATVKGANGRDSAFTKVNLGIPHYIARWFALVRTWTPWLAPRHGKLPFAPQQGAIMTALLGCDGLHLVILAISGIRGGLSVLESDGDGRMIVNCRNDNPDDDISHVLIASANTFESANAAVMYHARKLVADVQTKSEATSSDVKDLMSKEIKPEWMENWYDGLTYCTWNALGQDLTQDKIFHALDVLKEHNIHVTNLIIDDNWQSLDEHGASQFELGWKDFEANPKGFPKGLKYTATTIRDRHPNIKHIAVWHAILGYWGAISPHGHIAARYKTKKIAKSNGGSFTVIDEPDIDRMYDDFYTFLVSCGIDSVKTDAQFMLDDIKDAPDRRRFITAYQDAWVIAALRHFSVKAISCMSQFPQNLFHTQLPLDRPSFMVRNSDDFFPEIPASHPFHIFTNAHNALFTSHLNVVPDWDMFQTSHAYSGLHAAGRCISGGPIYITDEPGKHNIDLIRQMTARTLHDQTIVLRPSVYGKTVNVYTAYEEFQLLRVGSFVGAKGGTSLLAVFNVSERALSEIVNLSSFPGIEKGDYVVRAHTSGQISSPVNLDSKIPVISLHIDVKGYEILSAYPVHSFTLTGSNGHDETLTKVAVLGFIGKMTGAAAVLKTDMIVSPSSNLCIKVLLKALGTLGIYVSDLAKRTEDDDFLVLIYQKVIPRSAFSLDRANSTVRVDVEKAWDEMGLTAGYGNELLVEITLS